MGPDAFHALVEGAPPLAVLLTFLVASVLFTLAPGPDILLLSTVATAMGPARGMALALGFACGNLGHTLAASLGVSALVAASPGALLGIKIVGAGYLGYLGIRALRERPGHGADLGTLPARRDLFVRGLLGNLGNPKVMLFFLAFLPQFADASRPASVATQMLTLGGLFTLQAAFVFSAVGLGFGYVGARLGADRHTARLPQLLARGIPWLYFAMAGLMLLV